MALSAATLLAIPQTMFAGRNRKKTIDSIESGKTLIKWDMLLEESHGWEVRPTTHPVEDGAPFTDHVEKLLRKGGMVGYITNFGLTRGPFSIGSDLPNASTTGSEKTQSENAAQATFDALENYRENVEPVTIVTGLKVYKNYVITSVKAKRDGTTGEEQGFAITFQEFKTVQLKEANIETTQVKRPNSEELKSSKDAQRRSPNANGGEQKPVRFLSSDYGGEYSTPVGNAFFGG